MYALIVVAVFPRGIENDIEYQEFLRYCIEVKIQDSRFLFVTYTII